MDNIAYYTTHELLMNTNDDSNYEYNLILPFGSLNDPYDTQGLAHFIEHLICRRLNQMQKFKHLLDTTHSKFNAFTNYDYIRFSIHSSTDLAHLDSQITTLLTTIAFTKNDFIQEKEIIKKEILLKQTKAVISDTPYLLHKMTSCLYPKHHLGSIESIDRARYDIVNDRLQQYVQSFFTVYKNELHSSISNSHLCNRNTRSIPFQNIFFFRDHRFASIGWCMNNTSFITYIYLLLWKSLIGNQSILQNNIISNTLYRKVLFRTSHHIIFGFLLPDMRSKEDVEQFYNHYCQTLEQHINALQKNEKNWEKLIKDALLKYYMEQENMDAVLFNHIWIHLSDIDMQSTIVDYMNNLQLNEFLDWAQNLLKTYRSHSIEVSYA